MYILFPLSVTLLFETAFYIALNRRSIKLFLIASIMNIILNVTMNFLLSLQILLDAYLTLLIIYEICTVFVESLILWITMHFKYWKTLLFSCCANFTSFCLGWILYDRLSPHKTAMIIVCSVFFALYFLLFLFVLLGFMKRPINKDNNDHDGNGYTEGGIDESREDISDSLEDVNPLIP